MLLDAGRHWHRCEGCSDEQGRGVRDAIVGAERGVSERGQIPHPRGALPHLAVRALEPGAGRGDQRRNRSLSDRNVGVELCRVWLHQWLPACLDTLTRRTLASSSSWTSAQRHVSWAQSESAIRTCWTSAQRHVSLRARLAPVAFVARSSGSSCGWKMERRLWTPCCHATWPSTSWERPRER